MTTSPSPDQWEQFIGPILTNLVGKLPGWVRNGFDDGSVSIEPMNRIALPKQTIVPPYAVELCPMFFETNGVATPFELIDGVLTGLDSVALASPITFPVQDTSVCISLDATLTVSTPWQNQCACIKCGVTPPPAPVPTTRSGALTANFDRVTLQVLATLPESGTPQIQSLTLQIVDDANWKTQPTIPNSSVTFDTTLTSGQQQLVADLLTGDMARGMFRTSAAAVVADSGLATKIMTMLNQALGSAI